MTAKSPAHAGVVFPPPLLYVIGLLAGRLLDQWRRLAITSGPSTVRTAGAVLGVALWLAIFLSAWATFRRVRTTLIPNRPANALATGGPYRWTRNPMYVSLVALYLGVALLMNSWWPVVLLPLVIVLVDRLVIAREERYLAAAFGGEYDRYRARVRRWV